MRPNTEIDNPTNLKIGLIPARWDSTRFEGKPIALIKGQTMIQRVYERAKLSKHLDVVVVLTDDVRIRNEVERFDGKCLMITDECATGTDRVALAVDSPFKDADIYVNIQGDEPLINPAAIDTLIDQFDDSIGVANAYTTIEETYKLHDNNVVKVVLDKSSNALYYSRWPIPYNQKDNIIPYQQLGLYAFNRSMLQKFLILPRGTLERSEGVEMLRYLENGYNVKMVEVDDEGLSVDTPEDLQIVEAHINGYN